jgi:hypothetical protein
MTDAYNAIKASSWYHPIDINSILLHVEFEGRLSLLVLRKDASIDKKWQVEIKKVCKI